MMNDLKWKDHIYSLSERSPFLFIVFILEVFHCERTMDLSLMHLQSTGSPSTATSSIKWRSLGKIWSGHLASFGYMTLICFFNIILSCSNYLTQVNNISNLSRRTKFRGVFFLLIGYYCIATQFFRFGNVVSARCTGHIDTPEILKRYLLIAKRIGHLRIIFNLFFTASPGVRFSKDQKTLRARIAIRKSPTRLFCKAGLFICCKGNKN